MTANEPKPILPMFIFRTDQLKQKDAEKYESRAAINFRVNFLEY